LASLIANISELFTQQQSYKRCKTKTAEIIRQQTWHKGRNDSHSKGRVSELTNGVGSDLRQWLRSRIAVYGAYWTAVDETAGVSVQCGTVQIFKYHYL
jgi:hypothetical protein